MCDYQTDKKALILFVRNVLEVTNGCIVSNFNCLQRNLTFVTILSNGLICVFIAMGFENYYYFS